MKNFETIAKTIENQLNSGNSRMTICTQNEFGGVYFLHVTVTGAETKPYAQYKEALTIYFKNAEAARCTECASTARSPSRFSAAGRKTTYEQPKSFWCFDKNLFYGLVDGFPQELKLAEESERVHLAEIQAKGKIYRVITMGEARRMTIAEFQTADELKAVFESTGEFHSVSCRAELQGAPKLKNFCGPMYDGTDEAGNSVIRYESREVYEILSA